MQVFSHFVLGQKRLFQMEKRKIILSSWFLIYCFRKVTFLGLDKMCKELVYEVFKIGCFQIGPGMPIKKVVESALKMKEKIYICILGLSNLT